MQVSRLDRLDSFITLDGSSIRELAGPAWTDARNQSLAEARVPAGSSRRVCGTSCGPPRNAELVLLCCCSPAYSDADTEMTE